MVSVLQNVSPLTKIVYRINFVRMEFARGFVATMINVETVKSALTGCVSRDVSAINNVQAIKSAQRTNVRILAKTTHLAVNVLSVKLWRIKFNVLAQQVMLVIPMLVVFPTVYDAQPLPANPSQGTGFPASSIPRGKRATFAKLETFAPMASVSRIAIATLTVAVEKLVWVVLVFKAV